MKKSKTKYAKCPSCTITKHSTELRKCMSILSKYEQKEFKNYKELGLDKYTYASFIDADFEWACDSCLDNKRAILASMGAQETSSTPHLAYSDTKLYCYNCKSDFIFKKEEKKAWYESYKLPTFAQPNHCFSCRKQLRKKKVENKTLSEILKKEENAISIEELEQVVEIYSSWDKLEKAKYFQSILNKRRKIMKE